MPCNCRKPKRYAVNLNGKTLFTFASQATANSVARRYPGSTVVDTKVGA